MAKPKTDKTNYRGPTPPAEVNKQLVDIANDVNAIDANLDAEIKGWWIWVNGTASREHERVLSNRGFFCSKSGKNTGKWYYKHPMAPRSYGRSRRYDSKSGKQQVKSSPKTSKPLTERDKLEEELAGFEKLYQIDSGENHININKMIADVKVKIETLGTHKPMPLQEFIDENKETETANDKEVSTEEKPAPTAAQLRDFFKK